MLSSIISLYKSSLYRTSNLCILTSCKGILGYNKIQSNNEFILFQIKSIMIAKKNLHSTVTVTGDEIIDDSYPIVATDQEFQFQ